MTHYSRQGQLKRRRTAGFSLTEMLVTTLILVLASTLLATGIPVAIDTYQRVVKTSNAQLALSTTLSALRSELGLATDVQIPEGSAKVYYYSASEGCWASIGNSDASQTRGLVKQYYKGMPGSTRTVADLDVDGEPIPLVSNEAISTTNNTDALKVTLLNPTKIDSSKVSVKIVVSDSAENPLASVGTGEAGPYRILTRFTE